MAVGLVEVHRGHSPFDNVWVDLGAALWVVAAIILVSAAGHFIYEWAGSRRAPPQTVVADEPSSTLPGVSVTAVEVTHHRNWLPNVGHLQLLVTYRLGNPQPEQTVTLVHARADRLTTERVSAWGEPRVTFWDATGRLDPVAIPPMSSREVTVEFFLQVPPVPGGGWVNPGSCEADVVLVDEFANQLGASHVRWE
jgi:hypothetical protein